MRFSPFRRSRDDAASSFFPDLTHGCLAWSTNVAWVVFPSSCRYDPERPSGGRTGVLYAIFLEIPVDGGGYESEVVMINDGPAAGRIANP